MLHSAIFPYLRVNVLNTDTLFYLTTYVCALRDDNKNEDGVSTENELLRILLRLLSTVVLLSSGERHKGETTSSNT